jgi:hypothetical protein
MPSDLVVWGNGRSRAPRDAISRPRVPMIGASAANPANRPDLRPSMPKPAEPLTARYRGQRRIPPRQRAYRRSRRGSDTGSQIFAQPIINSYDWQIWDTKMNHRSYFAVNDLF